MWIKKKFLVALLVVPLLLAVSLSVTYSQLQSLRTVINDVWDRTNHKLMTTSWAGQAGSFQTEQTIFNDVWDSSGHFLRTSGNAVTTGTLGQFAATTSAQFAGVISNETGTGLVVFDTNPVFKESLSLIGSGNQGFIVGARTDASTVSGILYYDSTTVPWGFRNNAGTFEFAVGGVAGVTFGAVVLTLDGGGSVYVSDLKITGAATGKKIVCVDTTTGKLYASSSGVACAN